MPCSLSCRSATGPMPLILVSLSASPSGAVNSGAAAASAAAAGFLSLLLGGLRRFCLGLSLRSLGLCFCLCFCLGGGLLGGSLLGRLGAAGQDFGDPHRGQVLAMAAAALGVLAAALLEGDDLAGAALLDHLGGHQRAIDEGRADRRVGAFADHQHFAEFHHLARVAGDLLDFQNIFGGNAVLLATGLDDCEHLYSFRVRSGSRRRIAGATGQAVFLVSRDGFVWSACTRLVPHTNARGAEFPRQRPSYERGGAKSQAFRTWRLVFAAMAR